MRPTRPAMRGALRASGINTKGSGSSATAAPSAEWPTTNCRSCIPTKNSPNVAKNWTRTVSAPALKLAVAEQARVEHGVRGVKLPNQEDA